MSQTAKILPFKSPKVQKSSKIKGPKVTPINLSEKRAEILEAERRQVKRTILTEFLGSHCIVPDQGLVRVWLHDVSESGISFDMENKFGKFTIGESVTLRVYFNHVTYFPFEVAIRRVETVVEEGVFRHGCALKADSMNREALFHFMKFIENVATTLRSDQGDMIVSGIK